MDNTKIRIKMDDSYQKSEEVSIWKTRIKGKMMRLWNLTEIFVNQKIVIVCELTVKIAPHGHVVSSLL